MTVPRQTTAAADQPAPKGAAVRGLVVLTVLNLLNYLDRYIVSAVLPTLKSKAGLGLSGTQAGWLASAFMIVYTLSAPLFGVLGDRGSRMRWIAIGVVVWSLATALGGLATSFAMLLVARALVGIGEAAYAPQAPPLLSDWFPKHQRGRIFSLFYAAFPFGSALGVIFGGYIDAHLNWRVAFFLAGIPGLLLAHQVLKLRPAPSGCNDQDLGPDVQLATAGLWPVVRDHLFRNPTYVLTVLAYAAYSAVFGAFLFWAPTFLVTVHNKRSDVAAFELGLIVAVAGIVGTLAGGAIGDFFFRWTRQGYLLVVATTTLLASAALVAALRLEGSTAALAGIALFALLLYTVTGPVNSALVNTLPPSIRATGLSVNVFAIHAFGDVWSPIVVGRLYDSTQSLRAAMVTVLPPAMVLGGLLWFVAALVDRRRTRQGGAR